MLFPSMLKYHNACLHKDLNDEQRKNLRIECECCDAIVHPDELGVHMRANHSTREELMKQKIKCKIC